MGYPSLTLRTISPREASIFACLADTAVAPEPVLPPVRETDAAFFFDEWLTLSPKLVARALRVALYGIELAPLALGFGSRMRSLDVAARAEFLCRFEKAPVVQLRQLAKLLKSAAFLAYYGDDRILLRCGYDAEANLQRGRALRAREGRP
jgi:hypothetical protein